MRLSGWQRNMLLLIRGDAEYIYIFKRYRGQKPASSKINIMKFPILLRRHPILLFKHPVKITSVGEP